MRKILPLLVTIVLVLLTVQTIAVQITKQLNDKVLPKINSQAGRSQRALDGPDLVARELLNLMDANLTILGVEATDASWNYNTDIKNSTRNKMNEASIAFSTSYNAWWHRLDDRVDYQQLNDYDVMRELRLQKSIGTSALDEEDLDSFNGYVNSMGEKLNNEICPFDNKLHCNLETEGLAIDTLEVLMGTEKDYETLMYYWTAWREVSGRLMLDDYPNYATLLNKAAVENDFSDGGEMWLYPYTEPDYSSDQFKADIEIIWQDLKPFYDTLHAYVRKRLMENPDYSDHFNDDRLIPANILGNMYAQSWMSIYDEVVPYPDIEIIDLTPVLEANISDVREMFSISEDFFVSIGLFNMTTDFRENSMYTQPPDKIVVCHASAWDFSSTEEDNTVDGRFRIKMCTDKNQDDFITIHHEMGHIEYYMSYGDMDYPLVYRTGANPGFHEAIGDTIALSVSTPAHLQKISDDLQGISKKSRDVTDSEKENINFLMKQALDKIAFLPFAYIIDQWRWDVFAGDIVKKDYNYEWWRMRLNYQGIRPPVQRTKEIDFDIGCKSHVATNTPYIRYFVASILQFQFQEKLCLIAGVSPANFSICDIYGSKDAGTALKNMLQKGASEPWQKQLRDFLEDPTASMSSSSIVKYFDPLITWLNTQVTEEDIGWDNSTLDDYFYKGPGNSQLVGDLAEMDANITIPAQDAVTATWNYDTDQTQEHLDTKNEAMSNASLLYKSWWQQVIEPVEANHVLDPDARRQVEMQKSIGVAIFNATDLTEFNDIISYMSDTMNAVICPMDDLNCDTESDSDTIGINELERKMGVVRDYTELLYYWETWREVSGDEYVGKYPSYVNKLNYAADLNDFDSAKDMWINKYTWQSYETQDFLDDIDRLWGELSGFYELLQAYTREKLKKKDEYKKYIEEDNLIPANILGNMYAQSWINIYDIVAPFPDQNMTTLTPVLEQEINNVTEMFQIAEDFFTSIGLYPMTPDFRQHSMYEQPEGKVVVCHASAMDFRSTEVDNTKDGKFRIKMCTNKNEEDFITIHHEMGHIEYFMSYSNQSYPLIYRNGANPGFHEAIGDTIALSVSTPTHMQMIIDQLTAAGSKSNNQKKQQKKKSVSVVKEGELTDDQEETINFLMKMALDKIAFLPYAYILDQWRWDAFTGNFSSDQYNYEWWRKRIDYQGVKPPIRRTHDTNFDIGCKYHVAANVPYIRYFMATILQFQFHQKLCILTNQPVLHKCDIYEHLIAGDALETMMMKGASEPWQQQLSEFLGDLDNGTLSSQSILDYFEPLIVYLENHFKDQPGLVGWSGSDEVLDDFFNNGEDISAIVPIIVGAVLAVLVIIVIIAFIFGQKRRKAAEKKAAASEAAVGKVNEAMEMDGSKEDI